MKKSGLALLLVISSLAQAQKTTKAPVAGNNTLLWEISGKGLVKPSYLFGTMHILCADDAVLSEGLKKLIKDVDKIYFELDMDNIQEVFGAMKYLRMGDNKKLSDLLSPEEYARIEKYFQDNNAMLPWSMLSTFKPLFISSLISEKMMSCEQKNGMEQLIMQESKQYNKDIFGLETAAFQAGLFDSIPYTEQAKLLLNYVDSIDSYKKATLDMVELYRKQNLRALDSLVRKSEPGMEQYMDLLLYDRNRKWAGYFPVIAEGGRNSLLIAVGAGHLPGSRGVIALLRKAGYTVKPLKN